MLSYLRRVSFNNLYPTYIDPSNPAHVPPQCKDEEEQNRSKSRFYDLNFGFGGATINNIEEHYNNTKPQQPVFTARKKAPKLPPPPSKSILKKGGNSGEINYTISKNYQHQKKDDPNNLLIDDDDDEDDDDDDVEDHEMLQPRTPPLTSTLLQSQPTKSRRKSFAEMTDEELILLEESYTTKSTLNIESFNFNSIPTIYGQSPDSKSVSRLSVPSTSINSNSSTVPTVSVSLEDGTKVYPSRPVVEHGACCISANHKDYDSRFGNESFNRVILSCITGRRHTWNAIDYMVDKLAHDGDHLVITSHIPITEVTTNSDLKRLRSFNEDDDDHLHGEFESSKSYNVSSLLIYKKCQDILDYTIRLTVAKKLILKISVEIINCNSSKEVFNDSLKLYKPHLFIIGSKTEDDSLYNRSLSICSSSSTDDLELRPPINRKNSSTVSTLGKGYNGYYTIGGVRCMKLTSYTMIHSTVPVIIVTNNYVSKRSDLFKSTFEEEVEEEEFQNDDLEEQFKKKLIAVSDMSRTKTINDIKQMVDLKRRLSAGTVLVHSSSSISSSSDVDDDYEKDDDDDCVEPKTFYPTADLNRLTTQSGSSPKVTFGDDLGFGNGQSIYKVKSLLDPVNDDKKLSRTNTKSSRNSITITVSTTTTTGGGHKLKKTNKTQRSKSDSSVSRTTSGSSNNSKKKNDDDGGGKFIGLSFKKFGFGKKK